MKESKNIAIIGGGPSGLMAAEIIATAGHKVTLYDSMPTFGRKFMLAGRGGLREQSVVGSLPLAHISQPESAWL